jgi:hypothetical protein
MAKTKHPESESDWFRRDDDHVLRDRALIEANLVDCMVALPGQFLYSTQITVCLWFLAKNKNADAQRGFHDRRQQTLFIDARKLGPLIDRVHRELTDADLQNITFDSPASPEYEWGPPRRKGKQRNQVWHRFFPLAQP